MSSSSPGYHPDDPQGAQPGWAAQQPSYPPPAYPSAPAYGAPTGNGETMGMGEAVQSVLTKYAVFSGRARRSEFWWFYLASVIVSVIGSVLDSVLGVSLFTVVLTLALIVPTLAVGARRLHDTGKSGWWQLIGIIPLVGLIVLIVFFAQEGQPGPNAHGPSPKYPAGVSY